MRRFTILALAVAICLGAALSPLASRSPDGLERVAREQRIDGLARTHRAPVSGYAFPGLGDARVATALAGLTGVLGVFVLGAAVVTLARRRRPA